MSALQDALGRVVADLRGLDRRIALVGGLAVSVRAEPRFTRDVDLAVVVTGDDDAEALSRALQARGYQVLAVVEQTAQRSAVELIKQRGFARGRDLRRLLEEELAA